MTSVPASLGNARFQIRRELGAGAFGTVYEAYDRAHDCLVALKLLRDAASGSLYRFKREFRSLVEVTHPNLIPLYELLSDEGSWFFTMELVDGTTFLEHAARGPSSHSPPSAEWARDASAVRRRGVSTLGATASLLSVGRVGELPLTVPERARVTDYARLRRLLVQLASGLAALHAADKLHRDIKPSNVMVTRGERVIILDFGLVADVTSEEMGLFGTPAYMAPEQAAGGAATAASDWYAVGGILYEALAGRLPFEGSAIEVLLAKQRADPRPPSDLTIGVPPDLEDLCLRLLRRVPAERPSAEEVLARLLPSSVPMAPWPRSAGPLELFGRSTQRRALDEALELVGDSGAVVLVHGDSGMGKTALVQEFLGRVQERHPSAIVLQGRCYAEETVPFKALDGVVDALALTLGRISPAACATLVPPGMEHLARVFPILGAALRQEARPPSESVDAVDLRMRAARALGELLRRLGEDSLLVVFIDDLHWGDLDSAALLVEALRPPRPPRLLLVVSYRSGEAETSHPLKTLLSALRGQPRGGLAVRDIDIPDLSADDARALAAAALGVADAASTLPDAIARDGRGSPFLIQEIARHVAEREGEGLGAAGGPVDDLLWARVQRLPEDARRAMACLAISGVPTRREVLRDAAGLGSAELGVVRILLSRKLLRARKDEADELVELAHDRVREAVAAHLAPDARRACHAALARAIRAAEPGADESLARHLGGAGMLDEAAPHAERAACEAAATLAFERAAHLYRLALAAPGHDEAARRRLGRELAQALAFAGRGPEAAQAYLEVADSGAGEADALALRGEAANQLLRSGYIDDGLDVLKTSLASSGLRLARSRATALTSVALRRAFLRVRGVGFTERRAADLTPAVLARIDTCFAVSIAFGMVDYARGADFQARHLLLALEAGEPHRVAKALIMDAAYCAAGGVRARARSEMLLATARPLLERDGDPYLFAVWLMCRGLVVWLVGEFGVARDLCVESEQRLRAHCRGVSWELEGAQRIALTALSQLGEIAPFASRAAAAVEDAARRGDLYAETNLRLTVGYLASLFQDDPDGAARSIDVASTGWRNKGFHTQHYWTGLARADVALYRGDGAGAMSVMEEPWAAAAGRALLPFHQYARIQVAARRARAALAAAVGGGCVASRRRELVQVAAGAARQLDGEGARWASALAELYGGLVQAARGETDQAIITLGSADARLGELGLGVYAAAARLRLGELMGGHAGVRLTDGAQTWMRERGCVAPERTASMVAPRSWRTP